MLLQLLRLVLLLLLVLLLRQAVVLMLLMLTLFRCYFIAQLHPTKKQQTSGKTGEAKNSGRTIGPPQDRQSQRGKSKPLARPARPIFAGGIIFCANFGHRAPSTEYRPRYNKLLYIVLHMNTPPGDV